MTSLAGVVAREDKSKLESLQDHTKERKFAATIEEDKTRGELIVITGSVEEAEVKIDAEESVDEARDKVIAV
jgi:hypothetical protein